MSDSTTEKAKLNPFLIAVLVFGGLVLALVLFANYWTDWLWFKSLGMGVVFTTQLAANAGLFVGGFVLMAGIVGGNMILAYRLRPKVRPTEVGSALISRFRDLLDFRLSTIVAVPSIGFGLLAGFSLASQAPTFLAWLNRTPFGQKDPYFGLDMGFFVFSYPWWRIVINFGLIAMLASLAAAAFIHFMTGAISPSLFRRNGFKTGRSAASMHLSILAGLGMWVYGVSILFDRFGIAVSNGGLFTGVHYTDQHSRIPAMLIMASIAFICGLLFFVNAFLQRWSIPGVSLVLMLVAGLILSGIYPWWVQTIDVNPNQPDKEGPFISENLTATRQAFGIDHIEVEDYEAVATVSAGQLKADAEALPAIRLMDPAVIAPAFEQLQQVRGYYSFPSVLDVDRYDISDDFTDAVVAVRELNISGIKEQNWNNIHTVYTHGYGLVAAYGNKRLSNGEPQFIVGDIPTTGEIDEPLPQIYFGEGSNYYVVVGAPEGTAPVELDTPGGGENRTETKSTFSGSGGISVGNWFNRLLYSIKFGDVNLMLTDRVNSASMILYDRTPRERVAAVAPWLKLDSDAYPTVVDGRIVWIIDGYTTSANYPNSTAVEWDAAISNAQEPSTSLLAPTANYVRNSVKAVVDAYDGSVKLYAWDEEDPVLQTWQKTYPGTVQPKSEISAELMAHLRYPTDLFKIQRQVLGRYHTTSSNTWFQRSDVWQVPADPKSTTTKEPPYYLTIKWPGDDDPLYSQTSVFVPLGRQNLSVYLAVNSDATSEDYGRMRALKLPDSQQVAGPAQAFNAISTDSKVAEQLLPFTKQGNTETIYGNLLTLPVGGGLLYVQPIYTRIKEVSGSYPSLRFVAVRFGEYVGIGSTLQQALDQVFQGEAGASTGENPIDPAAIPSGSPNPSPSGSTPPTPTPSPSGSTGATNKPSSTATGSARAQELLSEAEALFDQADEALTKGDLATYQAKTEEAKAKVKQAMEALG